MLNALLFAPRVLVSAGPVPFGLRIGAFGGIEPQHGGLEKRDDICGYVNIVLRQNFHHQLVV